MMLAEVTQNTILVIVLVLAAIALLIWIIRALR